MCLKCLARLLRAVGVRIQLIYGDMAKLELQYRKLHKDHPLSILEDACLALLSPRYATCRACEDICPVQAIRVGETDLHLAESCLNCGRCAAICPMGGLGLPGFTIPDIKQDMADPVAVDCWKVPLDSSPSGAVRVPCLGGLSAGGIAELAMSAGRRSMVLLDRGWCALCRAGGSGVHPVSSALEAACAMLEKTGMPVGELPRLESLHLPEECLPAEIPALVTQQQLSRRAFFGALISKTAVSIDQVKPLATRFELRRRRGFEREPVPSRERSRMLHGLQSIAHHTGRALPSEFFYRLEISDACCNHLLCARICPTGALDIYEEGNCSGLVFDALLCIGCGHCVTVCPNSAIRLLPNGNNSALTEPVQLTKFGEQDCPECGHNYPAVPGENVCPQCVKRHRLASSAFRTLFGEGN